MILEPIQGEKFLLIFLPIFMNDRQEIWLFDLLLFRCTLAPSGKIRGLTLKSTSPTSPPSLLYRPTNQLGVVGSFPRSCETVWVFGCEHCDPVKPSHMTVFP